ncbi:hypothetical protein PG989_014222 [Apiospora arundinis]
MIDWPIILWLMQICLKIEALLIHTSGQPASERARHPKVLIILTLLKPSSLNSCWGETKPRPTKPIQPDGRPKPAPADSSNGKEKTKQKSSWGKDSGYSTHSDKSSRGKARESEKTPRNYRWTCSGCNAYNLSTKRHIACPYCKEPRHKESITYFVPSDGSERTVTSNYNSASYQTSDAHGHDETDGFPLPSNNSRNMDDTTGLYQNSYDNNPNPSSSYQTLQDDPCSPDDQAMPDFPPVTGPLDTQYPDHYYYGDSTQGTQYSDS